MSGLDNRLIRVGAEHIALLRAMHVFWAPLEAGGPCVDREAPYGTAAIAADARRILAVADLPCPASDDDVLALHAEALCRLPIFVGAGELAGGRYRTNEGAEVDVGERETRALQALHGYLTADPEDAPVHFKRPYGEMTAYELDLAHVVGVAGRGPDGELDEKQRADLWALHRSLDGVLQVWLEQARFAPGDYRQKEGRWRHVEGDGGIALIEFTRPPPVAELVDAVRGKDKPAVERLLARGADPEATGADGHTAMIVAAAFNDTAMVELLVRGGAAVDVRQGKWKLTPLNAAAAAGAAQAFDVLLAAGASLAIRSQSETSPLAFAVLYGREAIVERIAASGWSEPGALGVQCCVGAEEASARDRLGVSTGLVVTQVVVRSTADRLGLQRDDVVVEVDGVAVASLPALAAAVRAHPWRDLVRLTVIREGKRLEVAGPVGPRIGEPAFKP
jgi:PDZ domain/Ankyrin repeats (3 copies)